MVLTIYFKAYAISAWDMINQIELYHYNIVMNDLRNYKRVIKRDSFVKWQCFWKCSINYVRRICTSLQKRVLLSVKWSKIRTSSTSTEYVYVFPSGPTSVYVPPWVPVLARISSVDKWPFPSVMSMISVVTLPSLDVLTTGILSMFSFIVFLSKWD